MEKSFGVFYVIVVFILPFRSHFDMALTVFLPFIWAPALLLSFFVLRKYYKNPNFGFKWVLSLLILYISGCLSVFFMHPYYNHPGSFRKLFGFSDQYIGGLTIVIFLAFLILNIIFISLKTTEIETTVESVKSHSDSWIKKYIYLGIIIMGIVAIYHVVVFSK